MPDQRELSEQIVLAAALLHEKIEHRLAESQPNADLADLERLRDRFIHANALWLNELEAKLDGSSPTTATKD